MKQLFCCVGLCFSLSFLSLNSATAQKMTPGPEKSIPDTAGKPDKSDKSVKKEKRTPLGTQVPIENELQILRATSSPIPGDEILQQAGAAHSSLQMSKMDTVAEGNVTVYTAGRSATLGVTILRNGEHQGQRIFLQQEDGKQWDSRGDHLTPAGKAALEFLETENTHGIWQLLESLKRNATVTDNGDNGNNAMKGGSHVVTVQEKDGTATRYYLDKTTSRMTQFEFVRGQSKDKFGNIIPSIQLVAFSDYRNADGVATPFKVEHFINGVKQEELQLTKVQYIAMDGKTAVRR